MQNQLSSIATLKQFNFFDSTISTNGRKAAQGAHIPDAAQEQIDVCDDSLPRIVADFKFGNSDRMRQEAHVTFHVDLPNEADVEQQVNRIMKDNMCEYSGSDHVRNHMILMSSRLH